MKKQIKLWLDLHIFKWIKLGWLLLRYGFDLQAARDDILIEQKRIATDIFRQTRQILQELDKLKEK